MCGICGGISFNGFLSTSNLELMNNKAKHRGPDDEGYYLAKVDSFKFYSGIDSSNQMKASLDNINDNETDYSIGFGHRRLSILDLSNRGQQPMHINDSVLVYNGEIFNYIELKKELTEIGYKFTSESDTEVLLKAYDCWGFDCVNHFIGMWAFAIHDQKKKIVFLSRDRFGIKPLYYYSDENSFYFASEIKQLLAINIPRHINHVAVDDFLSFLVSDFNEQTFFQDIFKVKPGNSVIVNPNNDREKIQFIEYHNLNNINKTNDSLESASESLRNLLASSIELRFRSDVPIGACLSGGLDSSAIVSVAYSIPNIAEHSINTFTYTIPNHKMDERRYAETVIKHTNSNPTFTSNNESDQFNEIISLIRQQDEPFGSFSILASWLVMKSASEKKVPVLIDGQGADELFLGYEFYYGLYLNAIFEDYGIKRFIKEFKTVLNSTQMGGLKLIRIIVSFALPKVKYAFRINSTSSYLNKNYKIKTSDELKGYLFDKDIESYRRRAIYQHLQSLLKWEDRNSMAFSIETRLPFLDYRLVEHAISQPYERLINNGKLKYLLRDAVSSDLPLSIINRKDKIGFYAPSESILNEIPENYINELFDSPKSSSIFDMEKIKNFYSNKTNFKARFQFFIIETWMREFDI